MFLLTISRKNLNQALELYRKVLENLMKTTSFSNKPHYFLDFCAILEDIMNSDLTGRQDFDSPTYICIIISLVQFSIFLSLVHCTYPPVPMINFSLQYDLLKEKPMETVFSPENIYLREGGFLRMILKYIFIGLHYSQPSLLITSLKIVLKAGIDTPDFSNFRKKDFVDVNFAEIEAERYSIAYSSFPVRNGDSLYNEEFIFLYILTEITDILYSSADQGLLDFTLDFLQQINASELLIN